MGHNYGIIDTNKDGSITLDEVEKVAKDLNFSASEFMDNCDFNKDNKISKGEFIFSAIQDFLDLTDGKASKENFISFYGQDDGSKLFDKYDDNKDGCGTKHEVMNVDNRDINNDKADDKGLSGLAIAGIVVACAIVVSLIVALVVSLTSEDRKKIMKILKLV